MTGEVEIRQPSPKKPKFGFPRPLAITKVVAPIRYKRAIIKSVEETGYIEPIKVDPRLGADHLHVEERRNTLETIKNDLSTVLNQLDSGEFEKKQKIELPSGEDEVIEFIKGEMSKPLNKINHLFSTRQELNQKLSDMKALHSVIEKYGALGIDPSLLSQVDQQFTEIVIGTVVNTKVPSLNTTLRDITNDRYIFVHEQMTQEESMFLLIFMVEDKDAVDVILREAQYSPVEKPSTTGFTLSEIESEIDKIKDDIEDIEDDIEDFAEDYGYFLLGLLEATNIELERINEIELKMRRTKTQLVMWGWIPPKYQDSFKSQILYITENNADVEFREGELDPSLVPSYNNTPMPSLFGGMRGLVNAFGVPSHEEIDPFGWFALFFAMFFGIMFADVGHGTILMIIGLSLTFAKKRKESYPTDGIGGFVWMGSELFIIMGLFSILWGMTMGSLFGDETILWNTPLVYVFGGYVKNGEFVNYGIGTWGFFADLKIENIEGKDYILVSRNYQNLLVFSFAWGAITILTGLFIQLYQKLNFRHSSMDLISPIFLIGIYVFALLAFVFPVAAIFFVVIIVLGIFTLFYLEFRAHGIGGMMLGLDHVLSLLSNTFSFGRLLAMNTIHFVFAFLPYLFLDMAVGGENSLINHEAGYWPETIGPLWPFWILGAAIGAMIVVPVETTFSTLQALRLNWVEFFSKFYSGDGIPFSPVGVKRELTTES